MGNEPSSPVTTMTYNRPSSGQSVIVGEDFPSGVCEGLYFGYGGDVVLMMADGGSVPMFNIQPGFYFRCAALQVVSATLTLGIVAFN